MGPIDNDKLELRTCTEAWTIEAWIHYTGGIYEDIFPGYRNICGTDDEGCGLPEGVRAGWTFYLYRSQPTPSAYPPCDIARFIGSLTRCPDNDVMFKFPVAGDIVGPATIDDNKWHHVAW